MDRETSSIQRKGRKIRTLLFSTLFPSSARPVHGIFVATRLRHLLASEEVETRVVAPVPWFPSTHTRFGGWAAYASTPTHEDFNGVEVWHPRYALPPKVGMNIAPLLLALGARKTVAKLLREGGDFDLFDAHYYYPDGPAVALLARWFNKPFVITGRGTDLNLIADFTIARRWIQWTERRAAASILVCEALMRRLAALGGDPSRMHVARNGVDLSFFLPKGMAESRRRLGLANRRWFISIGHLVSRKGHEIAIRALAQMPPDIGLLVVGDGPERRRLESEAQGLGLADRVVFPGVQPQTELPYWYSAAEVLTLCSTREGWPNVLLESMACGTPVVAADVWGVPEVVKTRVAGRLVQQRTPEAVSAALLDVLSTRSPPEEVRAYASQFSWQETTDTQLAIFNRVIAEHSESRERNSSIAPERT